MTGCYDFASVLKPAANCQQNPLDERREDERLMYMKLHGQNEPLQTEESSLPFGTGGGSQHINRIRAEPFVSMRRRV